jgi:hypothetical protein
VLRRLMALSPSSPRSPRVQGLNRLRNRIPVDNATCMSFRLDPNEEEHGRRDDIGVEIGLLKSLGMMQATA